MTETVEPREAGPVLDMEEIERQIRRRINDPGSFGARRSLGDRGMGEEFESVGSWGARFAAVYVAALVRREVAAAEQRGAEKGAAKERERISEACIRRRDWARKHFRDRRDPQYVSGLTMGLEDGGRLARDEMWPTPDDRPGGSR